MSSAERAVQALARETGCGDWTLGEHLRDLAAATGQEVVAVAHRLLARQRTAALSGQAMPIAEMYDELAQEWKAGLLW